MPRRSKGPRLYLDPERREWVIRDGTYFGRTGCPEANAQRAEKLLAHYIARKYKPEPSSSPLVADVLNVYAKEHLPQTKAGADALYHINALAGWFGSLLLSDINGQSCRDFARNQRPASARRYLETLRAAIRYWHREYGPLAAIPSIVLPPKSEARERWLTKAEARRLRRAAMKWPHLYRFIVLGLLTGSRSGVLFNLQWDWIDFDAGVMSRRAPGQKEDAQKRTPPVRISRALVRLLRLWQRRDAGVSPYVVHYNGKPVYRVKRAWRLACAKAKLKGVTPHTLRHTRATWLMQAGVSEWEAGGHLGMSPETLRRVYAKHHPDFQKRAAEV